MPEQTEIRDLLIEIRTQVGNLLSQHSDHETRLRTLEHAPADPELARIGERLRLLERQWWILIGAATAAGGLAGKLAGLI